MKCWSRIPLALVLIGLLTACGGSAEGKGGQITLHDVAVSFTLPNSMSRQNGDHTDSANPCGQFSGTFNLLQLCHWHDKDINASTLEENYNNTVRTHVKMLGDGVLRYQDEPHRMVTAKGLKGVTGSYAVGEREFIYRDFFTTFPNGDVLQVVYGNTPSYDERGAKEAKAIFDSIVFA